MVLSYFEMSQGLFEATFPFSEVTQDMINENPLFGTPLKLVISEYVFNNVFR
jgi:hypothetical protein